MIADGAARPTAGPQVIKWWNCVLRVGSSRVHGTGPGPSRRWLAGRRR